MAFPTPVQVSDVNQLLATHSDWDAIIYISDLSGSEQFPAIHQAILQQEKIDKRTGLHTVLINAPELAGGRLIFAPTGDLSRDYDDVRRIADATKLAAELALQAGVEKPLLVTEIGSNASQYQESQGVAYLALCQAMWQPLEAREALGEDTIETVLKAGVFSERELNLAFWQAIEAGKRVARDLCGTEPERMAPPKFADYCEQAFAGTDVAVSVLSDDAEILASYPLLHAVARASVEVPRHAPRVIRLEYTGQGTIEKTLYLAGKGITFDTGGADLKVGGHMAGMSRDKGGAAAVAGIMKTVAALKPKGIKVVAEIGAVRNSIGADAFVPDEIITGHAGKRVRVGNTDAEGRMVLADILSHMREDAKDAVNPEIFSMATLTGHAAIAFGPYTALVENGPAKSKQTAKTIASAGEQWGDPAEQSLSRREDFDFVRPRTKADDVLSSNNAPSVATVRGHQFPMAFLSIASGLDQHSLNSDYPIPYTHVDIAGSGVEGGDWQHGKPTAAPVAAFAATYLQDLA
ncbi:leucyl aminopeptidase family protein [Aestuariibacter sp. AA17]|uniref:Leucyl aminopeptidase family protein n=1 Tax=Fluctibacter corallii TaxID=2984329 RepID=A0ABT3A8Q4_9ALTE|nr:leucyl aminopeptidase family protein [Aestuariibacter sp. AA17]MCV2884662.1 leucyl aminopeptidase family protein [Aestuariibacter sp. AA17]